MYSGRRSSSIPEPRVFLAQNVNNNKVTNICNVVMYVLCGIIIFVIILLFILTIMAWSDRDTNQRTTTQAPIPGDQCRTPVLMNNGICNNEIISDFDCLYDYPDCQSELKKLEECSFASQQSYLSGELAIEMYKRFPHCESSLQFRCSDFNLTKNGICDKGVMNNLDCHFDLPDCRGEHLKSQTCPFSILREKLSCEMATSILNDYESCQNVRICCSRSHLLRNGICNSEIKNDFQCQYDNDDCQDPQRKAEVCKMARDLSIMDCQLGPKLKMDYSYCDGINLCPKPTIGQKITQEITEPSTQIMDTTTSHFEVEDSTLWIPMTVETKKPEILNWYDEIYWCPEQLAWLVNDGICQDFMLDYPMCDYDGNDCCSEHPAICEIYNETLGLNNQSSIFDCSLGNLDSRKGDGKCHDALNKEECDFDGGDCCDPDSDFGWPFCLVCWCNQTGLYFNHTESGVAIAASSQTEGHFIVANSILGDYFCDDELNTPEFNYDERDCCQPPATFSQSHFFCHACECIESQEK